MKTKYKLMGMLIFPLMLWACEQRKIELYNSPRYLSFETNEKDTLYFSFFFTLDEEYEYPVVVNLTGDLLEEDREFIVKVDTASTLASDMFVLPERFVFRRGVVSDTFSIKLKNHPLLRTEKLFLKLRLEESEIFLSTGGVWSHSILSVTDIAIRPSWWDERVVERFYLGTYSKRKFELFMEATGITDMSEMSDGERRIAALRFKHWLADREPIPDEENGGFISVPVIG
ncbi:DUF4843 domain-containing protein [Gabonibacter chumensis]|uniref:DUF4843 domain-containing protein n=1 Tax=Gabonibacter chumensis TaxID=2972474 RepID=UPI002573BC6D|nr:DUF4843 domain-containing protein [Gabonibacter chumensis]